MHSGLVQVPVFVYPTPITFYLEDQTTHKQVLTLYNPYEFAIRFRVLCTSPNKYTVVDPEGSIRPRCCIDIVVRHNAVSTANCNVTDKFRIQMQNHATKQVIGKQDVPATLLPGKPGGSVPEPEEFLRLPTASSSVQQQFGLVRDQRPASSSTPTSHLDYHSEIRKLQNSETCLVPRVLSCRPNTNSQLYCCGGSFSMYWSFVTSYPGGSGFTLSSASSSYDTLEINICVCTRYGDHGNTKTSLSNFIWNIYDDLTKDSMNKSAF